MLPSWEEIDRNGTSYKKELVGKFVADVYGSCTADSCCLSTHLAGLEISFGEKKKVPWKHLCEEREVCIEPEYMPVGFYFEQWHKIQKDTANAILRHWTKRQKDGKLPLKFLEGAKLDRKRKRTSEEESDKEAEDEPPSADNGRGVGTSAPEDGPERSSSSGQERLPSDVVRNLDLFLCREV